MTNTTTTTTTTTTTSNNNSNILICCLWSESTFIIPFAAFAIIIFNYLHRVTVDRC